MPAKPILGRCRDCTRVYRYRYVPGILSPPEDVPEFPPPLTAARCDCGGEILVQSDVKPASASPSPEPLGVPYLLGEIGIDNPAERERDTTDPATRALWPKGWWAVSDEHDAYIAFFYREADACAFRLMIIAMRQYGSWAPPKLFEPEPR